MPTRPIKEYANHANEPFLKEHPRGIVRYTPPNPPYRVTFETVATLMQMSVAELGQLNFGTTDKDEIDWYCINRLGAKTQINQHGFNVPMALDSAARLWVPAEDEMGGLNHWNTIKAEHNGGWDLIYSDVPQVSIRPLCGALQAIGATEVHNTIGRDFKEGDVLLSEHMGDKFIQQVTMAWPTHAGIVTDDQQEMVTDAMPRGPGTSAIDSGSIREGTGSFFGKVTTPGGGLVYRYQQDEEDMDRLKKLLSDKQVLETGLPYLCEQLAGKDVFDSGKSARRARGKRRLHGENLTHGLIEAQQLSEQLRQRSGEIRRKAAAWAKNQVGKNYKFTLKSDIVGVSKTKLGVKVETDKQGGPVVPDKIFVEKRCPKCHLHVGSPGCCKGLPTGQGDVLCLTCGVLHGPNVNCDLSAPMCPKCGLSQGTTGCCKGLPQQGEYLCLKCGEILGSQTCCRAGQSVLAYGDGRQVPATYYSSSEKQMKDDAHAIYCAEFVWRAYRFGAGVTLVQPKDFFDFFKHPDRATYGLLWFEMRSGPTTDLQRNLTDLLKGAPHKITRDIFLNLVVKPKFSGRLIAPVQLAQSRHLKRVHDIPETYGYKPNQVYDVDDRNLNPGDVLDMLGTTTKTTQALQKELQKAEAEYQKWRNLYDDINAPDYAQKCQGYEKNCDLWKAKVLSLRQRLKDSPDDILDKWMAKNKAGRRTYTVRKPWDEATNRKQPAPS